MSFHFPQVFPLISDRSVWHNGKHPFTSLSEKDGSVYRNDLLRVYLVLQLHQKDVKTLPRGAFLLRFRSTRRLLVFALLGHDSKTFLSIANSHNIENFEHTPNAVMAEHSVSARNKQHEGDINQSCFGVDFAVPKTCCVSECDEDCQKPSTAHI